MYMCTHVRTHIDNIAYGVSRAPRAGGRVRHGGPGAMDAYKCSQTNAVNCFSCPYLFMVLQVDGCGAAGLVPEQLAALVVGPAGSSVELGLRR